MLTTIDALKEYLGDSTNLDDVLLTRIVTAASDAISAYCSRTFESTVYTDELYDGSNRDVLVLRNFPVITLSAVKEGGAALTIGTDPYGSGTSGDVYLNAEEGSIVRPFAKFYAFRKYYSVTYTAGFATIPASIVQACLDLSTLMVREKDHAGIQAVQTGAKSVTYIRQLPEFSQRALDLYQDAAMGRIC